MIPANQGKQSWWETTTEGVRMRVHVSPRAARTTVTGLHGHAIKIRLQAPPVEGKANAALVAFVADTLGIPRATVEIIHGLNARDKVLAVRARAGHLPMNRLYSA